MKKATVPYLTQYCNESFEWQTKGLDIDSVSEAEATEHTILKEKALKQSGLTCAELALIVLCRKHRIFTKVNTCARKLIIR